MLDENKKSQDEPDGATSGQPYGLITQKGCTMVDKGEAGMECKEGKDNSRNEDLG